MKKTILTLAIILVLILLGAPYITGKIAESEIHNIVDNLNLSSQKNGTNEILSYERSAYSTQSLFRYTPTPLHKAFLGNLESIDYQCKLDHGIVGIDYDCSVINNEQYTAFLNQYFGGNDPVSMFGSVSAFGGLTSTLSIDEINELNLDENIATISLAKTEININTDKDQTHYDVTGGTNSLNYVSGTESVSLNDVTLGGDLSKIAGGLFVGDFDFSIANVQLDGIENTININGLTTNSSAKENGENLDSKTAISIDQMTLANSPFKTIDDTNFIAEINGVNTQAMIEYQAFASKLQAQMLSADQTTPAPDPMQMVPIIERMLVEGFNITLGLSGKLDDKLNTFKFDLGLLDSFTMNDAMALAYAPQEALNKLTVSVSSKLDEDTVNSDANLKTSIENNPLFKQSKNNYSLDLILGQENKLNGDQISIEELQMLLMSSANVGQ